MRPDVLRERARKLEAQIAEAPPSEIAKRKAHLVDLWLQIAKSDPDPAARREIADRVLARHEETPLRAAVLERFAGIVAEQGDVEVHRRVLELLANDGDPAVRARALESLGDVFEQLGDRRAAVDSWKPAAQMREDKLREQQGARRLYERVLETTPDADAAERLVRLYADAKEWDRVPEVLSVVLRADADRGSRVLLGLESSAAADSFVSMVDEAVALRGPASDTVRDLRRAKARTLAHDPARRVEASLTYRALLENFGSDEDRVAYLAFIESDPDEEARKAERRWIHSWRARREPNDATVLADWARAEEEAGDREEAASIWGRAVARSDRPEHRLRLALAYEALGRLDEALDAAAPLVTREAEALALARRIVVASDAPEALGRQIVALDELHALDGALVVEALQRVLERAPCARWALDRVKLELGAQGRWDALFAHLDRAIAAAEGEARLALVAEAAFVAKDLAHDVPRAIGHLEALHAARPEDGSVGSSLERLYERADRKRDLVALLASRKAQGAAATELGRRVAALWLELDDVGQASHAVLALFDGGVGASDVADLVERIAAASAGDRLAAFRALARAAQVDDDTSRRRATLRAAAALADVVGDAEQRELYTAIFAQDATDAIATELLDRFVALHDGDHARLASVWAARAEWERAAAAYERCGATDDAIAAYGRAGSDAALEAVARLHTARGEHAEAARALEMLPASHAVALADAYVALGREDDARLCLEQALPAVEDRSGARARLIVLYRKASMWRPLVDLLDVCEAREAAAILRNELGDPAGAAARLDAARTHAPEDRQLRAELADVLESLGEDERLVVVLRELVAFGGDRSKERAQVHHRLARALARLGRDEERLVELDRAAKLDATSTAVLRDLGQVSLAVGDLELAERTLRALLLALRHRTDDVVSCTSVFLDLATVARRRGDERRAINMLESALDAALENGEDPSVVASALREVGRNDLVARAVEHGIARAADAASRAAGLRELAALWRESLARDANVGARLRTHADALDAAVDGQPEDVWAALWSVRAALGDAPALLSLVKRRLASGASREWLLESAAFCVKVDAFELAADVWSELEPLGGDPADLASLAWPLGRALERAGRKGQAERLYVSILERASGDAETLGRVARRLEALGSARLAECLDLAAAAAPTDHVLLDRLVAAYEDQWDSSSVVRVLRRAVDATPGDKALLLRLVEALRGAGEDEEVLPLLDRALGEQPADEELACLRAEIRDAAGNALGAIADIRIVRDARFAERVNALVARIASRAKELVTQGRAEEARAMLEPVVERDAADKGRGRRSPALAAAYLELARAHLALDELAEAFEALETGFMIDAKNVSLAMLTGLVAIDLGEEKTAERAFLAAVAAAGDAATRALAYYHLATAAHVNGDAARARRFVGKALTEDPTHDLASVLAEKLVAPVAQSG